MNNVKHEVYNGNSLMESTYMLDMVNSKSPNNYLNARKSNKIMKLVDKLDAIPLEMIVQHELEEIEAQQGEIYGETEIVNQSWI